MALANARALMREELGDKSIDFVEIIHKMREGRDIQLLGNMYGEQEAIAMVRGRLESAEDEASGSRNA